MNCLEWLPIYFGILKTGALAVPLNYRYTEDEIKYCLDLAECDVLIFGPEFTERVEAIREQIPTGQGPGEHRRVGLRHQQAERAAGPQGPGDRRQAGDRVVEQSQDPVTEHQVGRTGGHQVEQGGEVALQTGDPVRHVGLGGAAGQCRRGVGAGVHDRDLVTEAGQTHGETTGATADVEHPGRRSPGASPCCTASHTTAVRAAARRSDARSMAPRRAWACSRVTRRSGHVPLVERRVSDQPERLLDHRQEPVGVAQQVVGLPLGDGVAGPGLGRGTLARPGREEAGPLRELGSDPGQQHPGVALPPGTAPPLRRGLGPRREQGGGGPQRADVGGGVARRAAVPG